LPLLLDLFCCAGGASTGYARAGFTVIGVDIEPQPRYPFSFYQADAIELLDILLDGGWFIPRGWHREVKLDDFDAIAGSPPCQGYSVTKSVNTQAGKYPLLIPDLRERLIATGLPYIIENVEGARQHMINPVTLCGSQFGMRGIRNGHEVYLRRHRLFESNFSIPDPGMHDHAGNAFRVFGHGVPKNAPDWMKGRGAAEFARQLMGINWMNRHELDESIPPEYTVFIGAYARTEIRRRKNLIPHAA
jgi:DNA (cytosine-5)-methyltransferase 1